MIHTSAATEGQIYVPWINGLLMVGVITLVLVFRSSERLAYAYGMAVTGTITITLLLFLYYARTRWAAPLWLVVIGGGLLLLIDLLFVAANLTKVVHGAWLPLLIGIVAFTVMITWHRGREIVTVEREKAEGPLDEFIDEVRDCKPPLARVPGTAVFLNRGKETAPLALRTCVEHTHVLHKHVIIVSIETLPMPRAPEVRPHPGGRTRLRARRNRLRHSELRLYGEDAHLGRASQPYPEAVRRQDRDRRCVLFPVQARTRQGTQEDDGAMAKAAFIATSYITADAPNGSACRATALSSWVHASRYDPALSRATVWPVLVDVKALDPVWHFRRVGCECDGNLVARVAHHVDRQLVGFRFGEMNADACRHLRRDVSRCPDQSVDVPQRRFVPVAERVGRFVALDLLVERFRPARVQRTALASRLAQPAVVLGGAA